MSLPLGVFFGSFLSRERNEQKGRRHTVILFVKQTGSFAQAVAVRALLHRYAEPPPGGGLAVVQAVAVVTPHPTIATIVPNGMTAHAVRDCHLPPLGKAWAYAYRGGWDGRTQFAPTERRKVRLYKPLRL